MVSYEELIYNFTDIYLKSAVECSICKENYTMADDTEFLDDYMKFFSSLLSAVEKDDSLSIEDIKSTLMDRKKKELIAFQSFLGRKVAEQALENAEKYLKSKPDILRDSKIYTDKISDFFQNIFDEESLKKELPVELLRYVRSKEEELQERN